MAKEPHYTLLKSFGSIEFRQYSQMITAQVKISDQRQPAIRQGFRILASYIFGNNTTAQKIAMTAPVMQQSSLEKAVNNWEINFVMPDEFTLDNLPKPSDARITLLVHPPQRYIVQRFSGSSTDSNLKNNLQKLQEYITSNNISIYGEPLFAFYNPPWTLPFMRRNEVMYLIRE